MYNGGVRILLLNYEFPPVGGGAGNATYFLLQEFAKKADVIIDVVTSSPDDSFYQEAFAQNITIHRLPVGKNTQSSTYGSYTDLIWYSLKTLRYGFSLHRTNKYDLTHAFFGTPCGFLALLFRIVFRTPYIVSLRGADVPGYKARYKHLDRFIFRWLNRFFIWKYAAKVIANSSALRDLALRTSPSQSIDVIPNGVDVTTFQPNSSKRFDLLIITPGWTRLEKRKSIDVLIQAFSLLRNDQSISVDTQLAILGTGKELEALKQLTHDLGVQDTVSFLQIAGNTEQDRQQVAGLLASYHILCLPSKNEGMSNAVLEAMASGLPVLLTDTGGTSELLADGKNGYLITREAEDIYQKMKRLILDTELLQTMGRESRKKAEQMSWAAVAKRYFEIYMSEGLQ